MNTKLKHPVLFGFGLGIFFAQFMLNVVAPLLTKLLLKIEKKKEERVRENREKEA